MANDTFDFCCCQLHLVTMMKFDSCSTWSRPGFYQNQNVVLGSLNGNLYIKQIISKNAILCSACCCIWIVKTSESTKNIFAYRSLQQSRSKTHHENLFIIFCYNSECIEGTIEHDKTHLNKLQLPNLGDTIAMGLSDIVYHVSKRKHLPPLVNKQEKWFYHRSSL